MKSIPIEFTEEKWDVPIYKDKTEYAEIERLVVTEIMKSHPALYLMALLE